MSKTVAISEDIHIEITKKKTYLLEEYGLTVRISDLTDRAIRLGINNAVNSFVPNNGIKIVKKEDVIT